MQFCAPPRKSEQKNIITNNSLCSDCAKNSSIIKLYTLRNVELWSFLVVQYRPVKVQGMGEDRGMITENRSPLMLRPIESGIICFLN